MNTTKTVPLIPGLVYTGEGPLEAPNIAVAAREKTGKSTLATTLVNWPNEGDLPLILAFDPTGPESCAKLGFRIPYLRLADEPGELLKEKLHSLISKATRIIQGGFGPHPFTSIVCDCTSTLTETLLEEAKRTSRNPDGRAHYGYVLDLCKLLYWRIHDLGLPTVWIGWLEEAGNHMENGRNVFRPGGLFTSGSFGKLVAGKAQQVVLLDKVPASPSDQPPFLCSDGHVRRFHTKDYAGVRCEGRFDLPNPMPAHLGWLLTYIQQRGIQKAG